MPNNQTLSPENIEIGDEITFQWGGNLKTGKVTRIRTDKVSERYGGVLYAVDSFSHAAGKDRPIIPFVCVVGVNKK